MSAQAVEWVLVVYYGRAAHQATYGRKVTSGSYTKDYIQLSQKPQFIEAVATMLSVAPDATGSIPLTYVWPLGSSPGEFVFKSADRPHLKWETARGAPLPWKMTLSPSDLTPQTIPGDPTHTDFENAENEFRLLAERGAGQPYLMAIKLRDEPRTLHLRVYLAEPSEAYVWADLKLTPADIQQLASKTSQSNALSSSLYQSGGIAPSAQVSDILAQLVSAEQHPSILNTLGEDDGRALARYLESPGYGLFFDSSRNHDAWSRIAPLPTAIAQARDGLLKQLEARFPAPNAADAHAEALGVDQVQVEVFRKQIEEASYAVADSTATVKTRGSAQRAFAEAVRRNYAHRCAITSITTREFLVAAHIVPWSEDQSIRLDPSNGVCLSMIVDRAFEHGYLMINDDYKVELLKDRLDGDPCLREYLQQYDGCSMNMPVKEPPRAEYLARRRAMFAGQEES